jgi:hypothetical protein
MQKLKVAINEYRETIEELKDYSSQKDFFDVTELEKEAEISNFRDMLARVLLDGSYRVVEESQKGGSKETMKLKHLQEKYVSKFMTNIESSIRAIRQLSGRGLSYIVSKSFNKMDKITEIFNNIYGDSLCEYPNIENFIDALKKGNDALQRSYDSFMTEVVDSSMLQTLYVTCKDDKKYQSILEEMQAHNLLDSVTKMNKIRRQDKNFEEDDETTANMMNVKIFTKSVDAFEKGVDNVKIYDLYLDPGDCSEETVRYNKYIEKALETPREIKTYTLLSKIVEDLVENLLCF